MGAVCSKLGFVIGMKYGRFREMDKSAFVSGLWCLAQWPCVYFPCCCCNANAIVDTLAWKLPSPPEYFLDIETGAPCDFATYVKNNEKWLSTHKHSGEYRSVDGSGNFLKLPWLGASGNGYVTTAIRKDAPDKKWPDTDDLIKSLFPREHFIPAVNGANALFFGFATLIIHDFFRSDTGRGKIGEYDRPWINNNSSYLDLQPLYGWNEEVAKSIRTFKDGKLIHNAVAENRMDRLPYSKVILKLLSREHNYICDELRKRYKDRFDTDEKTYQHARMMIGAIYVGLIQSDYVGSIFSEWKPDGTAYVELRGPRTQPPKGYQASFEFNLMYRWHSMIPNSFAAQNAPPKWEDDAEITKILMEAVNQPAGLYHANNVPKVLLPSEKGCIELGRIFGIRLFNDFRQSIGLPKYASFEEMAQTPEVAAHLKRMYGHIDEVELFIGFMCEKNPRGGIGQPDTMGLALLADAFSSVTGDRFYSTHFTPEFYTPWGIEHCKHSPLTAIANRHLKLNLPLSRPLFKIPKWVEDYERTGGRSCRNTALASQVIEIAQKATVPETKVEDFKTMLQFFKPIPGQHNYGEASPGYVSHYPDMPNPHGEHKHDDGATSLSADTAIPPHGDHNVVEIGPDGKPVRRKRSFYEEALLETIQNYTKMVNNMTEDQKGKISMVDDTPAERTPTFVVNNGTFVPPVVSPGTEIPADVEVKGGKPVPAAMESKGVSATAIAAATSDSPSAAATTAAPNVSASATSSSPTTST